MKARVKSTGVLVDVTPQLNINSQHSRDYLYVCDNMVFKECELDFSAIDWEQRRYELAKSAMQGILSDNTEIGYANRRLLDIEKQIVYHVSELGMKYLGVLLGCIITEEE